MIELAMSSSPTDFWSWWAENWQWVIIVCGAMSPIAGQLIYILYDQMKIKKML